MNLFTVHGGTVHHMNLIFLLESHDQLLCIYTICACTDFTCRMLPTHKRLVLFPALSQMARNHLAMTMPSHLNSDWHHLKLK